MERPLRSTRISMAALALVAAATSAVSPARAQEEPDELAERIARIASSTDEPLDGRFDLASARNPAAPVAVLGRALDMIVALRRDGSTALSRASLDHLVSARRKTRAGLAELLSTSPDLHRVLARIQGALVHLEPVDSPDRTFRRRITKVSLRLTDVARGVAKGILETAVAGGAPRKVVAKARAAIAHGDELVLVGHFARAVYFYDEALGFAADVITFDIDLFEENIRDALQGATVGHSYAITFDGILYSSDPSGLARTATDPPETLQSQHKEMLVASMSKTVSAIALLKLLDDEGIAVTASISPYLPSDWDQGPNVEDVTFRRLLTHRSGLDAADVACCTAAGQTLETLEEIVADGSTGASDGQPSDYHNANYSLLRVLIPQIAHGEGVITNYGNVYPLDAVYAGLYTAYVSDNVFEPAGIDATICASDEEEDTRTLLYSFASPEDPGLDVGDWSLSCGATGWHLSAVELVRLTAYLRFTESILPAGMRALMDDLFLGWLDPGQFGHLVAGPFAVYRAHGGDYPGNAIGMTGCVMNFPIVVQASLLINSRGGPIGGHPCQVLKNAYDNAWVG